MHHTDRAPSRRANSPVRFSPVSSAIFNRNAEIAPFFVHFHMIEGKNPAVPPTPMVKTRVPIPRSVTANGCGIRPKSGLSLT